MGLVCGVGINDCPGWSSRTRPYENRVYHTWCSMLARCYSKKYQERQPTYVGCSVCDRWLTLSKFAEDIKNLPGYQLWVEGVNTFLDKDIRVPGNKVYSPSTCMFVTPSQSSRDVQLNHPGGIHGLEANKKRGQKVKVRDARPVKATNIFTGDEFTFTSQSEAAEVLGVNRSDISKVLLGKRSRCGNFYFERIGKD